MKVRNWDKFQQYKDRKPLWIKLHREILDDLAWHQLSPEAAKVLIMLWLLASETDGEVEANTKVLSFRLRLPELGINKALKELVELQFLVASSSDEVEYIKNGCSYETKKEPYAVTSKPVQIRTEPVRVRTDLLEVCSLEKEKEKEVNPCVAPLHLVGSDSKDRFAEFWSAYPRKTAKAEARKVWDRMKLDPQAASILKSLESHKITDQWSKDDGKFIPHATTWLRQRRWEDEVESAPRNNAHDCLPAWMTVLEATQ